MSIERAVQEICAIMRFENWLRFYFLKEEGPILFVRIPDKAVERITEDYPQYLGLVEELNNKEINYERSVSTVCQFVVRAIDAGPYPSGTAENAFDSDEFKMEMQLFTAWQQAHESQLDEGFMDFGTWEELFEAWKGSDEVQAFFAKVRDKQVENLNVCETEATKQ